MPTRLRDQVPSYDIRYRSGDRAAQIHPGIETKDASGDASEVDDLVTFPVCAPVS